VLFSLLYGSFDHGEQEGQRLLRSRNRFKPIVSSGRPDFTVFHFPSQPCVFYHKPILSSRISRKVHKKRTLRFHAMKFILSQKSWEQNKPQMPSKILVHKKKTP